MSAHSSLGIRARQRGVVLVIALLMLLVLTLIGVAATRSTTLEQRMTANQNDQEVAFEAAEAALRNGESTLSNGIGINWAGNTAGAYTLNTMTVNWKTINWDASGGAVYDYTGLQPNTLIDPTYFIVQNNVTGFISGSDLKSTTPQQQTYIYYVYARGVGLSSNNAVILESVYEFQ